MSSKFLQRAGGLTLLAALFCSGCSLFGVHRVAIQQGNIITQAMVDQLKPGITREQVAYIMGEPVLRNTFDDDRWDYVYTIDVPDTYNARMLCVPVLRERRSEVHHGRHGAIVRHQAFGGVRNSQAADADNHGVGYSCSPMRPQCARSVAKIH